MHSKAIVTLSLAGCFLLEASSHARPERADQIPNGRCVVCHVDPAGGGPRNLFGAEVEDSLEPGPIETADIRWDRVCDLDSDGDGATNGLELGDPNCQWAFLDPDPGGPTFNPGDPNDSPTGGADGGVGLPDAGGDDAGPDPMDGGAGDDSGPGAMDTGGGEDASGGATTDAGVQIDAGGSTDASTPPSGGDDGDNGGCTCTREGSLSWPVWFGLLSVIFVGFALRRRPRRENRFAVTGPASP